MGSDLSCFVSSSFASAEAPIHHGGVDIENAGHHVKDSVDASAGSWESAWIDLGGEG